jgi:hypothetical protein
VTAEYLAIAIPVTVAFLALVGYWTARYLIKLGGES